MTLLDIDTRLNQRYVGMLETQKSIFEQLKTYPFDLSKREMTDAILHRMDSNWVFNDGNNKFLGRNKKPSSADFFTETCLFFIKAYLEGLGGNYQVRSEKTVNIVKSRNIVKPDISIWKGDSLVGVIELKTQNDWFRNTWEEHLKGRETQVKMASNTPGLFFAVIAHVNFFDESAPEFNSKYFGLRRREGNAPTEATIENLILGFLATQK
jgi:hypothetical protein